MVTEPTDPMLFRVGSGFIYLLFIIYIFYVIPYRSNLFDYLEGGKKNHGINMTPLQNNLEVKKNHELIK